MVNVLVLKPAFGDVPTDWFPDIFSGNTRVPISFNNWNPGSAAEAVIGMNNLDAAMRAQTGPFKVYGHSFGARIAAKWLRELAPTSTVPTANVTLYLTGNMERKYNGAAMIPGTRYLGAPIPTPAYGGIGIPDNTRYTTIDLARQYDFFADQPNDQGNTNAVNNANAGQGVHSNYSLISFNDPQNISWTEGNITYKLSPTYPLPLVAGSWMFWAIASQDAQMRPGIEAGYHRGPTVSPPPPPPNRVPSTSIFSFDMVWNMPTGSPVAGKRRQWWQGG
jgi:hypothetical protein